MSDEKREILNKIITAQSSYANTAFGDFNSKYDALTAIGELFKRLKETK